MPTAIRHGQVEFGYYERIVFAGRERFHCEFGKRAIKIDSKKERDRYRERERRVAGDSQTVRQVD